MRRVDGLWFMVDRQEGNSNPKQVIRIGGQWRSELPEDRVWWNSKKWMCSPPSFTSRPLNRNQWKYQVSVHHMIPLTQVIPDVSRYILQSAQLISLKLPESA